MLWSHLCFQVERLSLDLLLHLLPLRAKKAQNLPSPAQRVHVATAQQLSLGLGVSQRWSCAVQD